MTLITGCAILLCIAAYCHHQWLHTLNSEFQQHRTTWWLPSPHQKAAAWRTASILKQDLNTLNQHTGLTHWLFPQTIQLKHKIQKHYQHLIQTELMSTLNTALNRQLSAHQSLEKRVEALEVLNQFKHPHSTDQHSVQYWISTQIGGYITQPWANSTHSRPSNGLPAHRLCSSTGLEHSNRINHITSRTTSPFYVPSPRNKAPSTLYTLHDNMPQKHLRFSSKKHLNTTASSSAQIK